MKLVAIAVAIIAGTLMACNNKEISLAETLKKGKWIDLSYDFSSQTLYWPNNPSGFRLDTVAEGLTPGGYYYSSYAFTAPEHGGTHLDAPVHFAEGALTADQLKPEQLCGEAVVIDVTGRALKNRDYLISVNDIISWIAAHDSLPENNIVLFRTGYGQYYPDAQKYFGTAKKGVEGIASLHFPGIDPQAAAWLVRHKVKAVGIDTPSIDFGQSADFRSHRILMEANIPAFENVANLDKLPESGAYVIAMPMKIKNGSGGPLRIIAWIKNSA
jgi:kynurenine formamidase